MCNKIYDFKRKFKIKRTVVFNVEMEDFFS
jgi:hypothetical protein